MKWPEFRDALDRRVREQAARHGLTLGEVNVDSIDTRSSSPHGLVIYPDPSEFDVEIVGPYKELRIQG